MSRRRRKRSVVETTPPVKGGRFLRVLAVAGITAAVASAIYVVRPLVSERRVAPMREQNIQTATEGGVAESEPPTPAEAFAEALPLTTRAENRQAALVADVAAAPDSWPTESFSEAASLKLKRLADLAAGDAHADDELRKLVAPSFSCPFLRPRPLTVVVESPEITVRRWSGAGEHDPADDDATSNNGGLGRVLPDLFHSVVSDARLALKIVRVEQTGGGFDTVVHAEGGGRAADGMMQWTAAWNCRWSVEGDQPLLDRISVVDYEEVESRGPGPWLVDVTAEVLGDADGYRDQLLYGMDYWVNRLEHRLYVNRLGHHGLAIGDVDGDGREDLYVCQPGGLPNRLYLHQADGTAREGAAAAQVDFLDDTTAALLVDLDNDGDQDLALLTVSGGFVFANDGRGRFTLRATMPECGNTFSLTAADYDRDGLLDLYVGRYWPDEDVRGAIPLPVPYYDARNGGANVLLKNEGDWRFRDVTHEAGLDVDNSRYTMAAAWEDYDDDGDADLYVANDFGRNCLYRNDGGRFTNVAPAAGVEDTAAGMSVSWSDYNRDGTMDVYVGNMFSSAGNRIAYQRQYEERFDADARTKLQRLARGNSLFQNRGDGTFADVSEAAGATMGRWAWGSVFVDLDNDAWDDLVVANGHVTTEDTGDL